MINTQTQIDSLIDLAVIQRTELKQLIESLPQLRDHLSSEIERNLEEIEPAIRSELEQFVAARALDTQAKTSAELSAKLDAMARNLESTTAAKYSVLMAERAENANLLAKAEARIEDAASMLSHAVKEIVTDELSRFPRAGEIDQLRKEFAEPKGLNPRGRWMPDETYQRLDLVTINGDSFVSNIDGNRERPSRTAGDWTLSAARGNGGSGGGATTLTDLVAVPANGQILIGNGSAFVNSTLTAGTNITITNGPGSITIEAAGGSLAAFEDGTAAAPSIAFINELSTGVFRASTNVLGFAVGGTSRATMTNTGITVAGTITPTGSVHAASGSVGNPSLAFNSDQDTGLFRIGADNIGVAAGGAKVLDIATTGLGVTGTLSVSGVATLGAGAILNTPASGTLTNATGLPISTGVSGLGANVATFLATPSSANLAAAVTDETGTGALVFATSPTLTTPISATLTAPAANNLTLTSGLVGTNRVNFPDTLSASSATAGAVTIGNGTAATNVAIGGGKVNIGDTTAGSSGAGALVVAGGISAEGASYFGGAVSIVTTNVPNPFVIDSTSANLATLYKLAGTTKLIFGVSAANNGLNDGSVLGDPCFRTVGNILFSTNDGTGTAALKLSASTGAATFGGAVSAPSLTLSTTPLAFASGGTGATTAGSALAKITPIATTVTSATPVTLTNTSANYQIFTGSTTQTILLPVTSTLETGWTFSLCNNSSATLVVQTSAGTTLFAAVPVGTTLFVKCIATGSTAVTDWEANITEFSTNSGTGSVVLNGNPTFSAFSNTGTAAMTGAAGSAHTLGTNLTTGTVIIGGTATTGTLTFGQSTAGNTINIDAGATASGATKTLNIGTGGLAGSTTAITIGSAAGTSTTEIKGDLKIGNAYVAGAVVGTGYITIQDSTGTTYRIPVLV